MGHARRLSAFLLICGLLLAVSGGCAKPVGRDVILHHPGQTQETAPVSLSFFGFKADAINLTAIESALQGFMDEREAVSISYEGVKGSRYWDILEKRAGTDNMDDVVMVDHDRVIRLGTQGRLADLSQLPGLENFAPQVREQFTNPDGTVWFLPTCISTYNLYINYDLLDAYGQSVPTNWGELERVCDSFVDQGIVPMVGNNYASLSALITAKGLFPVYQRPDTAQVIQSYRQDPDALAAALQPGVALVAEMLHRGWFDPQEVLATAQTSDDLDLFAKGDRPFLITGGWASIRLPAKGAQFSYGVHPFPILEDGSVLSTQVDTCVAVNADSAYLDQAEAFVAYLIRPDVMWAYCDSQASYTPLREETRLPSEPTLVPSTPYLTNGRISMRSDYRLELPVNTALRACGDLLLKGGTVDEAMDALSAALKG